MMYDVHVATYIYILYIYIYVPHVQNNMRTLHSLPLPLHEGWMSHVTWYNYVVHFNF
jgi:hypothetical protein